MKTVERDLEVIRHSRRLVLLFVLSTLTGRASLASDEATRDVVAPPDYDTFLVIPLRVHVLTANALPEIDCHLSDADVARILRKVNRIWAKAGISWGLESLVREPAARQARFRLGRDLEDPRDLGIFRILIPDATRRFDGLHVYYIHQFPVNGVWMGEDFVFVQETARLRPVEGGIDEPVPRVTAHELGHRLGLGHRQGRTNLLASGTTGTTLNGREVEQARAGALRVPGVATVARLKEEAAKASQAGDPRSERRIWSWLAEIPGAGAGEARERLEELEAKGVPARPQD